MTVKSHQESLNIHKTVVLRILKEDLGERKLCKFDLCLTVPINLCPRFVPRSLTPEQREDESHLAKTLLRWPMQTKKFNKIVMGDETWCFANDPEAKRQSSEWVGETSARSKELKFQTSRIKTMLIIFSTLKA
jgi:hypothetical protein